MQFCTSWSFDTSINCCIILHIDYHCTHAVMLNMSFNFPRVFDADFGRDFLIFATVMQLS
jgi:hypothetical protein